MKTIVINEREYFLEELYVRGRTSSARIKDGKIIIRLSRFVALAQRDKVIADFLAWAKKRLQKVSASALKMPTYKNGSIIITHNKNYELRIIVEERAKTSISLEDGLIFLRLPRTTSDVSGKSRFLIEKVIMEDQTPYLHEVVDELNQLFFQAKYKSCRFKRMKVRFGSCSSKGNLNFAFRLLFAPREVFRYVCTHELAHLQEFNHSSRFWDLVEVAMPEYKESEAWLRNNGFLLG